MLRFSLVCLVLLALAVPASAQIATTEKVVISELKMNAWHLDYFEVKFNGSRVKGLGTVSSVKLFYQGVYIDSQTDSMAAVPNVGKWVTLSGAQADAFLAGKVSIYKLSEVLIDAANGKSKAALALTASAISTIGNIVTEAK